MEFLKITLFLVGAFFLFIFALHLFFVKKKGIKLNVNLTAISLLVMVACFGIGSVIKVPKENNQSHITTAADQGHKEISAGQVFGEKTTQTLNEQSQYVAHTQLDNGNMEYMDTINDVKMNRIDDYTTGVTTVYLHDDSKSDGLGRVLYTGKTIAQDDKKKTVVVE